MHYLPTLLHQILAEFIEFDGSIFVNVASFDKLIDLFFCWLLAEFAQHLLQLSCSDMSILVFVVHVEGLLESLALIVGYLGLYGRVLQHISVDLLCM